MSTHDLPETESNGQKIGKYVAYQRNKRGLTLRSFSRLSGLDLAFIQRLEKGAYQGVSIDAILKIATAFSMSIEAVLSKSKISSYETRLPSLSYVLRETYQLPKEAIAECESYIEFLQHRYKKEIAALKRKHKKYWELT